MTRLLPSCLSAVLAAGLAAQDPAPVTAPPPATAPAAPAAQGPGAAGPEPAAVALDAFGETVLSQRIKSLTRVHNSMPHQLLGIGIVAGLPAGSGSTDRGTRQAILNIVRQFDLNLTIADVIGGTTALVTLTCNLPPFAKQGMLLDVKCEVFGDALSLRGGELLRAELKGVDGLTYVVAQGALVTPGFGVAGTNAQAGKNPFPTAWLNNGGVVVREEQTSYFSESGALELQVLNPSPFNAASIADGIRRTLAGSAAKVTAVDPALVRIELPEAERTTERAMEIQRLIGNVRVPVENPAKVMIDQASGVVLAGEGVLISPCVVGHSELTITIVNEDDIVQPNPFAGGETARVSRSRVEVQSKESELRKLSSGATVADLLQNLKALGLNPSQLVLVFQSLDQGGFLHAQLEVR